MAVTKSNQTQQFTGKFKADGKPKILKIRSDVDSLNVKNWTQAATQQAAGRGVEFKWQRNMAEDTGIEYKKTNNTDALNMVTLASGGFTLLDSGAESVQGAVVVTTTSAAAKPVVATGTTTGVHIGSIIRLQAVTAALNICGMDIEVGAVVPATSFTAAYAFGTNPAAGADGTYRIIKYDNNNAPKFRYITEITQADPAVITMSVTHGYSVGQRIKIVVPEEFEMVEMNNLIGTVTVVDTVNNTVTVDIDASAFTDFAFPADAKLPFSPAITVPIGNENSLLYINRTPYTFSDEGYIGILLETGAQSPAGSADDIIYWEAKTSFSDTDET